MHVSPSTLEPAARVDPADLVIERIEVTPIRVPLARRFQGSHYSMTSRCTIITRVHLSGGIVGEAFNGDTDAEQDSIVSIIVDDARSAEPVLPSSFDRDALSTRIGCDFGGVPPAGCGPAARTRSTSSTAISTTTACSTWCC